MYMKEKILDLLKDIDSEIIEYTGENLFDDGIIDSFTIMEIVSDLSDQMNVKILPTEITEDNFKTVDAIINFVSSKINQ